MKSKIQAVQYQIVPLSNCPTIKTVDIFFSLVREPTSPLYLSCVLISSNLFPCLLWLNFEYWITCKLGWYKSKSTTAYVLHNFSNVLADWYFSWLYLNFHWLSFCGVFPGVFSPCLRKKDTGKKSLQKMFLETLKNFKILWPHFMDGVQLLQG